MENRVSVVTVCRGIGVLRVAYCGLARVLLLALLFSATLVLADKVEPVYHDIPLPLRAQGRELVLDSKAEEGVCFAADTQSGGSLPVVKSGDLPPGFYQAWFRLKMSDIKSVFVSRLRFTLSVRDQRGRVLASRKFRILAFEKARSYQLFHLPFVLKRPGSVKLAVSWSWQAPLGEKRPFDMRTAPKLEENLENVGNDDDTAAAKLKLADMPYYIAMDKSWIRAFGPVGISHFEVDKLRYLPGGTVKAQAVLVNYGQEPVTIKVVAELLSGIDRVENVFHQQKVLAPGRKETVAFTVKLSDRIWGRELRCRLLNEAGRCVSLKSDYFTVHTNPWAVAIGGFGINLAYYRAGPNNSRCKGMAAGYKKCYTNTVEFVFWAPDDFGDFNPVKTPYWSGQMRHQSGAESTKGLIKAMHEVGVACSFYALFTVSDGKAGYELYRRHPDWFSPEFYDVDHFNRWNEAEELISWPRLRVRPDLDAPYLLHAREIIRSVKNFGWDAIRYDTDMSVASMADNKPYCARIFPVVKKMVNKECPGFQWGFNDALHRKFLKDNPLLSKLYREKCANGGMIMDEFTKHGFKDKWSYKKFASRMVVIRDSVHALGGHVTFCPPDAETGHDLLYHKILPLVARSHNAWDIPKGDIIYANYNKFATRFAGYLWDNRVDRLKNAGEFIDWGEAAKKLFLWDSYVYLRRNKAGQELIMQLVNMPPKRIAVYQDNRAPDPLNNLHCKIKLPSGLRPESVWNITADPDIRTEKLAFTEKGGFLSFTVPRLRFWDMIVVRFKGEGRWQ